MSMVASRLALYSTSRARWSRPKPWRVASRSEEHTSELQSPCNLVCRLLLEKKKTINPNLQDKETSNSDVNKHLMLQQSYHMSIMQMTNLLYSTRNNNEKQSSCTGLSV